MNTPYQPLSAEDLDELLSAELDGELERAATDLGLTPAEARSAIDATPAAPARREELVRARDALATPPALAPADATRLVASALAGAAASEPASLEQHRATKRRSEGAWRVVAAVGSVAAVIAVIVAVGASNPGSSSKSSSADSSGGQESTATVPRAALSPSVVAGSIGSVEFGDVSQLVVLRAKVRVALNAGSRSTSAKSMDSPTTTGFAVTVPGGLPGTQGPTGAQGSTGATASGDGDQGIPGAAGATGAQGLVGQDGNAVVGLPTEGQPSRNRDPSGRAVPLSPLTQQICIASAARVARVRTAPAVTGTGTYNGRPVVVVAFRRGSGYTAYVMSTPACSLVARQAVP